ncbi:hypothetical protein [Denitromonas iodatirespirans]|uniref:Uncharacterized protein n=1 Tax=Denitromonas iodatirespirans TaxID=2795389 RepID=A0A944H8R5_DENI1|nr:hypothetical protein [Denitromonas iodatirespirans]MBT0961660.1 hypothetical protein [Denitromonas iodatirespirans]
MKIYRAAGVAIGIEPTSEKIRFLGSADPADPRPPYIGSATAIHLNAAELLIANMSVTGVTRAHLRLIAGWAIARGYRWIYAERLPGHTLPLARRRTERPFADHFEIDLAAIARHVLPPEVQCAG